MAAAKAPLVCLLVLFFDPLVHEICQAQETLSEVSSGIARLQAKLDAYASSQTVVGDIQIGELNRLSQLYQQLPTQNQMALEQKSPEWQLIIELALIPMKRLPLQIKNEPDLVRRHLQRVEFNYKRFKPAYHGKQIGEERLRNLKIPKTVALFEMLSSKDKASKLTINYFKRAKMESEVWRERLSELIYFEDIYSNLEEFQNILNYLNHIVFSPLFSYVFPAMDTGEMNPKRLARLYYRHLWNEFNIGMVDGSLRRVNLKGAKVGVSNAQ